MKKHNPATVLVATGATRRNNLRAMIGPGKRFANQQELAIALGVTDGYITQLIGARPIRRITESVARKFEYRLLLPYGTLDKAA